MLQHLVCRCYGCIIEGDREPKESRYVSIIDVTVFVPCVLVPVHLGQSQISFNVVDGNLDVGRSACFPPGLNEAATLVEPGLVAETATLSSHRVLDDVGDGILDVHHGVVPTSVLLGIVEVIGNDMGAVKVHCGAGRHGDDVLVVENGCRKRINRVDL